MAEATKFTKHRKKKMLQVVSAQTLAIVFLSYSSNEKQEIETRSQMR